MASASGVILDIDHNASLNVGEFEKWQVQALDALGGVIAFVDLLETTDGAASAWAFNHGATDNIHSIRFHYTGTPNVPVGFALDNIQFHRCARPVLTQVALKGDVAPNTGGAQWKVFSVPAINFAGNNAFRATLAGAGVSASNDLGIWAGAGLPLVIRKGDAAPCVTGAFFREFSSPVLNDLDQVAFRGLMKLGNGGVLTTDDAGVWTNSVPSGLPTLIAREYVAYPVCGFPPCVPAGAKYKLITSIAMPNGGGVAFTATLLRDAAAGVNATNDFGLWHSDTNGEVDLLLRKGDVMVVNGTNRTVSGITVLPVNVPYVSGTGRTLERTGGKITCRITFSGTPTLEGIFNL